MSEPIYTQEQLDIQLLKNNENHIFKILERLEQKVDSHFHWMLVAIFGLYGIALTGLIAAIGKAYNFL